jgi:hypothetical protein
MIDENLVTATSESLKPQGIPFLVDGKPYYLWDFDVTKCNASFINSFQTDYFRYVADTHSSMLDGENSHFAATALRQAYSQGLETLFALIASALQAPDCVLGWMTKYSNNDLESVVTKILENQPLQNRWGFKSVTWKVVAEHIFSEFKNHDSYTEQVTGFSKIWEDFAVEYVKVLFKDEYNSLKHGFRVSLGETRIWVGEININESIEENKNRMYSLKGDGYGALHFKINKIMNTDKVNLNLSRSMVNWNVKSYRDDLYVISASICNIISWLKLRNKLTKQGECLPIHNFSEYFEGRKPSFNLSDAVRQSGVSIEILPYVPTGEDVKKTYTE